MKSIHQNWRQREKYFHAPMKNWLSPEEEERIFQNVCQKLQLSPEKKRKHFPRKRMGIFLAAATFLLSITVGAAEYFHLNPEFLQYFHAVSENERQTLKDMAALPPAQTMHLQL